MTIDRYTKNALQLYWKRGDDEEVLTDEEVSDLEGDILIDENEIAKIFRIKTDIFDFKMPLCKSFKEFNYLLKIDTDLLTDDIPGFKTYEEFKNEWIDDFHELDYEFRIKLEEYWWRMNDDECSPFTNWRNFICGRNEEEANQEERESEDDHDIIDFDNDLD
ncbi:hypothetical protein Tco_0894067 [Tanacetum coccineum]|uniref:Uncharacterized protein n=1 Tax=Tanacetum coccineum TaxID=301880 RepID=A0ABQ5CAM1_9ASTR